ncbi:GA-binding protein subunit beta-1-like [Liolophura sinensis]|uniref:GA-binding protein subunit beta-1-like n=1 Tax=Liolophura sinensis TaxID=3198878 RepID=UPI0031580699
MSLVDLGKRLLEAAKKGDTDEVRTLMSSGAPFTTDWLGTSPLHFASQNGHLATAEVLLRAGISRDARTKVDRTPLHVAAQAGHVDIVELLLTHQADLEAKDMLKMTPLHWATEKGHPPVIEMLVKQGAQIHVENKFGKSPLDIAGDKGRLDLIGLLSQNGEITVAANSVVEEVTAEEILTEHIPQDTDTIITEVETETLTEVPVSLHSSIPTTIGAVPIRVVQNDHKPSISVSESSEQSSTSVLATLAALAEATAPLGNASLATSTTDAMNLLENHGITMISTNDGNILASAVESGQSITLTEAGKLAINLIKQQALQQGSEVTPEVSTEVTEETVVEGYEEEEIANSQYVYVRVSEVIAIVTDQEPDSNTVVVEVQEETAEVLTEVNASGDGSSEEPAVKKLKLETDSGEINNLMLQVKPEGVKEPMKDDLRKQLEEVQRQAEEYKQQLLEKEAETEEYKKRLSELTPTKKVHSKGPTLTAPKFNGINSSIHTRLGGFDHSQERKNASHDNWEVIAMITGKLSSSKRWTRVTKSLNRKVVSISFDQAVSTRLGAHSCHSCGCSVKSQLQSRAEGTCSVHVLSVLT